MTRKVKVVQGDIVEQKVDAIVNAANKHLGGGTGIDGAIWAGAGVENVRNYLAPYKKNGIKVSEAIITNGGNLQANKIIWTAGPDCRNKNERKSAVHLLTKTYENCIDVAIANKLTSIAFPSISTGVFGFSPKEEAVRIAVETVCCRLQAKNYDMEVSFVAYTVEMKAMYDNALKNFYLKHPESLNNSPTIKKFNSLSSKHSNKLRSKSNQEYEILTNRSNRHVGIGLNESTNNDVNIEKKVKCVLEELKSIGQIKSYSTVKNSQLPSGGTCYNTTIKDSSDNDVTIDITKNGAAAYLRSSYSKSSYITLINIFIRTNDITDPSVIEPTNIPQEQMEMTRDIIIEMVDQYRNEKESASLQGGHISPL